MERYELPEGWEWRKMVDVCIIERGGSPRPIHSFLTDSPDGINWIKIGDTKNVTKYIHKTEEKIIPEGAKRSRMVYEGDFILSNSMSFGRPYIMKTTGCIHDGWLVLRKPSVDQDYLYHVLCSEIVFNQFYRLAAGSTVRNLNISLVKGVEIPTPPLPEQRRIVARIEEQTTRLETIRDAHNLLTEEYRQTLAGFYSRIIEGVDWLPMADVAPLVRRPVTIKAGESYHELGIRSFGKGTFHKPAIAAENLGTKRIFHIHPGDLLFNIVFAWEGAVAVARPEDRGRVGSHRFLTRVPKPGVATSPFLYFHFTTEKGLHDIGDASPGGAGRNRTLGLKSLDAVKVPVPSYHQQEQFSKLWEIIETARRVQQEQAKDLDAFTPALLAKAFRGEL